MSPVTSVTKLVVDLALFLTAVLDISKMFNHDSVKEEVLEYEKLRRNAISRYQRKVSRDSLHKNTEQRSTVLPRTRRILPLQDGIHDESQRKYVGPRLHPSKYVRNEPRTVGARKRILNSDNGG
jgi:hypothetical protein